VLRSRCRRASSLAVVGLSKLCASAMTTDTQAKGGPSGCDSECAPIHVISTYTPLESFPRWSLAGVRSSPLIFRHVTCAFNREIAWSRI
jgi:hypothetical protein